MQTKQQTTDVCSTYSSAYCQLQKDVWNDRLRCAFAATRSLATGTRTREARPPAAADGSRWPIFDFEDAHWTCCAFMHKAPTTAPTCTRQFNKCAMHLPATRHLNWIPERGARAVRFKRTSTTHVPHRFNQSLLRRPIGCRQAGARTILLYCSAQCGEICQIARGKQERTAALTTAISVCTVIERVASTQIG